MKQLREYLKERNIPKDSLEANSILEGYEKGYRDALKLIFEMRKARNKYSALSREFCSKGMKPRQSWEWQEARKLTKKLEAEMDLLLKDLED